jgi:hypothetical protein
MGIASGRTIHRRPRLAAPAEDRDLEPGAEARMGLVLLGALKEYLGVLPTAQRKEANVLLDSISRRLWAVVQLLEHRNHRASGRPPTGDTSAWFAGLEAQLAAHAPACKIHRSGGCTCNAESA